MEIVSSVVCEPAFYRWEVCSVHSVVIVTSVSIDKLLIAMLFKE